MYTTREKVQYYIWKIINAKAQVKRDQKRLAELREKLNEELFPVFDKIEKEQDWDSALQKELDKKKLG